ncbi:bifunctional 4-hydroxy-2-oxoglutarate aldolase/2-dehydro-3-deoxy-phosphogluconate aldolase [Leucobacter iarius]|uniref:Bifunctional 2-keto-4-hydroxyglutarate aldolase/2-keto-3-deoxy-6-phosphogluconate aldolase n=1 Tax=Leucobacter iarius TaxID=333963 RepID=A0ABN2L769_9MICO
MSAGIGEAGLGVGGAGAASTLGRLADAGTIAVLRASSPGRAIAAGHVLIDAGVRAIEVTFTVPDAHEVIAEFVRAGIPGLLVGAGTLTRPGQVEQALAGGASFLVAPGFDPEVAAASVGSGRCTMLGAFTPSEVQRVLASGADAVKFFPGGLAGPTGIRALSGPFPEARFVPTGGVTAENVGEWFAAGALAVGAGSELAPERAVEAGDLETIRERATRFLAAVRAARAARG